MADDIQINIVSTIQSEFAISSKINQEIRLECFINREISLVSKFELESEEGDTL
jgi:hypothetical protein